ncbi:MAG: tRNA lysidine(34) synthetase TilS [Candidatus Flexifilum sp.]
MPRGMRSAQRRVRGAVLAAIRDQRLIAAGAHVVAAVSGGADSLCLLHVLGDLQATFGFRLTAATFDHGLRGADGAADAAFVVELCARWGIPCHAGRAAAPLSERATGIGLEAAARRARYEFLLSVCQQVDADTVAVGHHADDQAETVLLRLLRGSGLTGIAGMTFIAPMPYAPGIRLIRPLLRLRRQDCAAYCAALEIAPREDATNADRDLLRNRIRLDVLPLLRDINPRIEVALNSLAEIAAVDEAFLDAALQSATPDERRERSAIALPRRSFRQLAPALRRRWIVSAARRLIADERAGVDYEHVLAAEALALRGGTGKVALLGSGLRLRLTSAAVVVERWQDLADEKDAPPAIDPATDGS